MTPTPFRFDALGDGHDRARFRCGDKALDGYFQTQVTQDIRRGSPIVLSWSRPPPARLRPITRCRRRAFRLLIFRRTKLSDCRATPPCQQFVLDDWPSTSASNGAVSAN